MEIKQAELPGILLIRPDVFVDDRGWFLESWNRGKCPRTGLPTQFVQDNLSFSKRGVLRGLHFQNPGPQGKLIQVLQGSIFDVAVDLRRGAGAFGKWYGIELSAENRLQLFIPAGFAHGFQVVADQALVSYKCTAPYLPGNEHTLRWDDPAIGIDWPIGAPLLSPKDARGSLLDDLAKECLFD